MSLSIQSAIHVVPAINHEVEPVQATKVTNGASKAPAATSRAPITAPKPVPKLDERAQIQLLALQGHSNLQIAATVGLPESEVALTLGDSTSSSSLSSAASDLVSLNGRLSVKA